MKTVLKTISRWIADTSTSVHSLEQLERRAATWFLP
jgi:hypothetical protein